VNVPTLHVEFSGGRVAFSPGADRMLAAISGQDKAREVVQGQHSGQPLIPGQPTGYEAAAMRH